MIANDIDFDFIRRILLNRPTVPEHQIAERTAKSINVDSDEEIDNPLVRAQLRKHTKFDTNAIIHYTLKTTSR